MVRARAETDAMPTVQIPSMVNKEGCQVKTIWKYQLAIRDVQKLQIPSGATLLSVQFHHSYHHRELCAWFVLDPEMKPEERTFRIFNTGMPVENAESLTYLNTVQDGDSIRHIFEDTGMKE